MSLSFFSFCGADNFQEFILHRCYNLCVCARACLLQKNETKQKTHYSSFQSRNIYRGFSFYQIRLHTLWRFYAKVCMCMSVYEIEHALLNCLMSDGQTIGDPFWICSPSRRIRHACASLHCICMISSFIKPVYPHVIVNLLTLSLSLSFISVLRKNVHSKYCDEHLSGAFLFCRFLDGWSHASRRSLTSRH